jgi:S-adenosylmethionine synthetase
MPKKKKEKEDDSPVVTAIKQSIEARKSSIIKAIELLAEEYYERLTEDDFGRATDTLSDEVKASVFITLPVKDMRDRWLERHARIVLI